MVRLCAWCACCMHKFAVACRALRPIITDLDSRARHCGVEHLELLAEQRVALSVELLRPRCFHVEVHFINHGDACTTARSRIGLLPLLPDMRDDPPCALVRRRVRKEILDEVERRARLECLQNALSFKAFRLRLRDRVRGKVRVGAVRWERRGRHHRTLGLWLRRS